MCIFAHVAPVVCFIVSPSEFNVFQKCLLVLNGLQQTCASPSVFANRLQEILLFLEHFLKGTERTQLKNLLALMELVKNLLLLSLL